MLVDLLPSGVKEGNPLLQNNYLSTLQYNMSRYNVFSYWLRYWSIILPYEIYLEQRSQSDLGIPPVQPNDDLPKDATFRVVGAMAVARGRQEPDAEPAYL